MFIGNKYYDYEDFTKNKDYDDKDVHKQIQMVKMFTENEAYDDEDVHKMFINNKN